MLRVWDWFVRGGIPPRASTSDIRQVLYVNTFCLLAIVTLTVFGFVHVITNDQVDVGVAELLGALVLVINVVLLRKRKSPVLGARVLLAVNLLLLIMLLITGGVARTGAFWLFTHLPAAYFLRGWKEGSIWTGTLVTATATLGVLAWQDLFVLAYAPAELRQLAISVVVVAILMFIFERSRAQFEKEVVSVRELKSLQKRFSQVQSALNESIAGIIVVDATHHIRFVNQAWLSMFRYDRADEILDKKFPLVVDEKEGVRFEELVTAVLKGEEYTGEIQLRDRSGNPVVIWGRMKAAQDAKGKQDGFIITGRDITEQKEQEARNRAVLDALPDLYFRMNRDGEYLDYHAMKDSDLYVPPKQLLGKKMVDVLPAEVAEKGMAVLKQVLKTQKVATFEYQLTINDENLLFEAHLAPLGSDEVVAVVRDVTAAKKLVSEMSSRTRELERMNNVMIDRELKMKELKAELKKLKGGAG